ncbi:MAG: 2,3,4,5-tetrahydropyridine-2,6-dicarboxylate N-succinyltransferase, partial [Myxococcales bacterium]|nr:2,3,4,5-tetrahydropyridine-2,6-dicarboxylate N-succinyltransferase [Myxococcales bacterium]
LDASTGEIVDALLAALNDGTLRAAEKDDEGVWRANATVKKGILLGFRLGRVEVQSEDPLLFSDKHTFPIKRWDVVGNNVRIVPGGSSIRNGAFIGRNVTCMPPMYVNVGAYVDDDTLIDSHALVGSCAQIGKRVHISAAAQIGGVLEPVGQAPVVVEDDVLVGGNTGIYEGTVVRAGAVIGTGAILTASTPIYDLINERIIRASADHPLEVPEAAVVVAGSRPAKGAFATANGLHIYTPLIVKYRNDKTDLRAALEGDLR